MSHVFSSARILHIALRQSIIEETLTRADGGAAIQDKLEEITGQRSVPNIFLPKFGAPDYSVQTKAVEGHEGMFHVGGNSEAQGVKKELGKWAPAYTASIKA